MRRWDLCIEAYILMAQSMIILERVEKAFTYFKRALELSWYSRDENHELDIYDYMGNQLTTFGSGPGPKPGQLSFPYDVGIDALGRIFVADNINHRVVRYGPAPSYTYRGRWGSYGSRPGQRILRLPIGG